VIVHASPGWAARFGSVRARTTLAATVLVAAALAIGGVSLTFTVRAALEGQVRAVATQRVAELVAALRAGSDPEQLTGEHLEDTLAQIRDAGGAVVGGRRDQAWLTAARGGRSEQVLTVGPDRERFLVLTRSTHLEGAADTVVVAGSLDPVDEITRLIAVLLAVGVPVLMLLVAGLTWRSVAHALAPVEQIRSRVDQITAQALDRRVPEPAGRDEILSLAQTMNLMLARLQDAHVRQQRFVADASHELRSPLACIRQHAEVTLADPGRWSAVELAGTVLAEQSRLEHLVEDLLLLARADEHTLRLAYREVDVDDLAFDEAARLRLDQRLQIDTTAVSPARTLADAPALRRVLRNLGDNAARHADSTIALGARPRDHATIMITVDDDGPGIPAPDRDRVLQRFVRLDQSRGRDDGGSGLGLAIAHQLVHAHHGQLTLTDSPLGGLRVIITLSAA
jgi:signal transduction histidine kinase